MNLIYPMFAMALVTVVVLMAMFSVRVSAVKNGLPIKYFKTFESGAPSEAMIKTERHYANLFEAPVLFYVACLAAMIVGAQGGLYVFFAWFFVAARIAHAVIHLGRNKVLYRMTAFFLGWFAILGLWITLVLDIATRG